MAMTPLNARWYQLVHAAHCLVGDHAWTTEVPDVASLHPPRGPWARLRDRWFAPAAGADDRRSATTTERSTVIRQRCLYCSRTSPGITQAAQPGYHYSTGMERPDRGLILHNPRLGKGCICVGCEDRRKARRTSRSKVQPIRKTA
jgi:hypothetical protein